jgi:hypothetical protein
MNQPLHFPAKEPTMQNMTGQILIKAFALFTRQYARTLRAHMPELEKALKASPGGSAPMTLQAYKEAAEALRYFGGSDYWAPR